MNDNNKSRINHDIGISIDGRAITCGVADESGIHPVPIVDNGPLASSLVVPDRSDGPNQGITPTGVTGLDETDHSVDVFPRFDDRSGVPATNRGRFALEAVELFKQLRTGIAEYLSKELSVEVSSDMPLPVNATVSVPGLYDKKDRDEVAEALESVGIPDPEIVRAPVASAAAYLSSFPESSNVVTVEIGEQWFNAAIIKTEPESRGLSVQTRVVESDIGRAAMDRALAERVIKTEQTRRNYAIEPTSDGFSRIQAAAHEAIDQLVKEDRAELSIRRLEEVRLGKGKPPISIEQEINEKDLVSALENIQQETLHLVDKLVNKSGLTTEDIDHVVIAGSGAVPASVRESIGSAFDQDVPQPDERWLPIYQPAYGAARLSALRTDHDPIRQETTAGAIGIRLPTPGEELEFKEIVPQNSPVEEEYTIELQPVSPQQVSGVLDIATQHQTTGELTRHEKWGIVGLSTAGEEPRSFTLNITPLSDSENIVDLTVEGATSERVRKPPAPEIDLAEREWFVDSDTDPSDVNLPETEADLRPVEITDPVAESLDEAGPKQVLETLLGVRYELWKFTEEDNPVSPSDLREFLERYDTGLRRINVDIISPEEGSQKDPSRHMIWDTEPSTEPDGSILRVRKPGYEVDGYVESPAQVIVSKGEPETDTESPRPADGTEETSSGGGDESERAADSATSNENGGTARQAASEDSEVETATGSETNQQPIDGGESGSMMDSDRSNLNLETDYRQQDDGKCRLTVTVRKGNGVPLEGIHVDVMFQSQVKDHGKTDARGKKKFTLPSGNTYKLVVTEPTADADGNQRKADRKIKL